MITADHAGFIKYWQSNMNNVKMYQGHKEPIRSLRWDIAPVTGYSQLGSKTKLCFSITSIILNRYEAFLNLASSVAVNIIFLHFMNEQKYPHFVSIALPFVGVDLQWLSTSYFSYIIDELCRKLMKKSQTCKLQIYLYLTKYALFPSHWILGYFGFNVKSFDKFFSIYEKFTPLNFINNIKLIVLICKPQKYI